MNDLLMIDMNSKGSSLFSMVHGEVKVFMERCLRMDTDETEDPGALA